MAERLNDARRHALRLNPLALQLATGFIGGALIIAISLYSSSVIHNQFDESSRDTTAALTATEIREGIDQIIIQGILARLDGAAAGDPNTPLVTVDRAIVAHDTTQDIVARAQLLDTLVASPATREILDRAENLQVNIAAFVQDPTTERLAVLSADVPPLRDLTQQQADGLRASVAADQDTLQSRLLVTRVATTVTTVLLVLGMTIATLAIGRRLRRAAETALDEEARLQTATSVLEKRNEQLASLYQVISEVTESLSLRYVIATTIRETRRLVSADVVGIRQVEGAYLVVSGVEADAGLDVGTLAPVPLGHGLVGRAAKRASTVRSDEGASSHAAEGERIAGMESALVVPLIVGARIVGTLSCWSQEPHHFTADDQRILEMMASQVATAISAASMHEQTEQQASHDALTQLPNRRQLTQDIDGPLAEAIADGRRLAIGMADIDHFKKFNDSYGHRAGDLTLQKVAEVLRESVRQGDVVYRFGGEEFLIVFNDAGPDEACALAERLRSAVEHTPFVDDRMQPVDPVTISIGLALCPDHGHELGLLIDTADRAMYASKESGRNRATLAGHEPRTMELAA